MYKYSHTRDGPWMGEFDHPQKALEAGRAMMGVSRVWVGQMEAANFSDMFIGVDALLDYMCEDAQDQGGSDFYDPFDKLPRAAKRELQRYLVDAIGEWEAELPDELQFSGMIIKTVKGYTASAMVRRADFAE